MFRFASPFWLLGLVIPVYILFRFLTRPREADPTIRFSNIAIFRRIESDAGLFKRWLSLIAHIAAFSALVIAMARPQAGRTYQTRSTYGIDIMLAMDISSSMAAMDFDPLTRFEASAEVVKEFISNRTSDRIGLVVFAAQSFTLCPLTLDYDMVEEFVGEAWESRIDDGTAIGSAIATAVNRLRDSEAASKVIILLTDGMNNQGNIDPVTAAQLAQSFGIRVYTIGVGTEGQAPMLYNGQTVWTETHIDEATLREVAESTGGNYYRAKNARELFSIYDEINELETTKINFREWVEYDELYHGYLGVGFILALLSFVLDRTICMRIP